MAPKHGTFVWHELNTRNIAANRAHYEAVYGWHWEANPMPDGIYYVARLGDEMVAGMFDMDGMPGMENIPDHWLLYMAVDDCDASVAAISENSGTVIRPPFDVEGVGRFAIVQDAGGAAFGIMQDTM